MNAYEQVCFYSASNGDTSAQTHKVVGIARHYRFHAGLRTDELYEAACNGEYDILFTSAASTDCTGILPAVTGVDNDGNDVGTFRPQSSLQKTMSILSLMVSQLLSGQALLVKASCRQA